MLTALFRLSSQILPNNSEFAYYRPSVAYINAGVAFNILRCGQRHLITDCHFIDNNTTTIFNTSFVATELMAEIDSLKKDNEDLRHKVLTLAAHSSPDDIFHALCEDSLVKEGFSAIKEAMIEEASRTSLMKFSESVKLIDECIKEKHCED